MEIVIVLILIAAAIFYILWQYRNLSKLRSELEQLKAKIQECIKQRLYIVQDLAGIISTFPNQGRENAQLLIKMRDKYIQEGSFKEAQIINNRIVGYYQYISKFPAITSSQQYLNIRNVILNTEKVISEEKQKFNNLVDTYNIEKKKIPNNIFSTLLDYEDEVKF